MNLRAEIPADEFDYQTLLSALSHYRYPRDRITKLLRDGVIIRVKKGLYVFGDGYRHGPVCGELLANLIHGPSYVSLDYALFHHGWIPERVETVTSVSTGRAREFLTPLGRFTYHRLPLAAFRAGVDLVEVGRGCSFLLAQPGKALADKLYCDRIPLTTQAALREYLLHSLRVESDHLRTLDADRLDDYASRFRSRKIRLLARLVRRLARRSGSGSDA